MKQEDWDRLFSKKQTSLTEEEIMLYAKGQADENTSRKVEDVMSEDDFTGDALEGLELLHQKEQIPEMIKKLNTELYQLTGKKYPKKRRKIDNMNWIIAAIAAVLLFVFIIVVFYMTGMISF
jgi:hypothetical protein